MELVLDALSMLIEYVDDMKPVALAEESEKLVMGQRKVFELDVSLKETVKETKL